MFVVDLDNRAAGWVFLALRDLRKRMAIANLQPPPGVDAFAEACRIQASEGHGGSDVAGLAAVGEAVAVARLTTTYSEAADLMNVSLSSVKRLVRHGDLTSVRIAGSPRIRVSDLEAFVAGLEPDHRSEVGAA